jgi:hypothetical protein
MASRGTSSARRSCDLTCTHVPDIAANEVTLTGVVVQNGRKRRVGVRLRLAVAEARTHGTRIGAGRAVELRHRPGEV